MTTTPHKIKKQFSWNKIFSCIMCLSVDKSAQTKAGGVVLPCDWTLTPGNPSHLSTVGSLTATWVLPLLPLLSPSALLCMSWHAERHRRREETKKNKKNRSARETERQIGRCEVWTEGWKELKAWERKREFHAKAAVWYRCSKCEEKRDRSWEERRL